MWIPNACLHGPLTRYAKFGLRMCQECRERFARYRLQRKSLVCNPDMHHGTHVPWFMSGSLTRVAGKAFAAFQAHAQPAILLIWQEAHAHARWCIGKKHIKHSFYQHGRSLIPTWMRLQPLSIYKYGTKLFTSQILKFDGAAVEVWEWMSNFTPHMIIILK